MPAANELSATEVVAAVTSGALRVVDIAQAVIARIEARDGEVQAFAHFDKEALLRQAEALDRAPVKGPLHGVPLGIKDVFNTRDMPTAHNSPRYAGSRPGVDAAAVDTLRAAGALLVGKTVTTEFAATLRGGKTRNPHDPARTPGGSSSGSAASVADFQTTIALGTQTGGSTIRPGSFNGVYAMKPTWNSISREGFKMGTISADTVGLYARTAEDLALLADVFDLDALEGPMPVTLAGARVAICRTPVWPKAQPEVHAAMTQAEAALRAAGAVVSDLDLPEIFARFADAQARIHARETRSTFLNEYRTTPDLHEEFKARVEHRDAPAAAELREAYKLVDICRALFDDIAAAYDVILTPSATGEAPLGQDKTGDASFNSMWTLLQVPVVNVPGFHGPAGMPVGLSLVARRYEDRKVIAYAGLAGTLFAAEAGA
jgi:Asp-tRNA(Asn)/Glu-tRNA(Gln) amidotransferase A subunit family amidase